MAAHANLLFVDDERQVLTALRALFRAQYRVFTANTPTEALTILGSERIHVLVSDQRMPDMLGHELLRRAKRLSPGTLRLLLTGYSDLAAITDSINEGEIFRFIHKPWDNNELRALIGIAARIALDSLEGATAPPQLETEAAPHSEAGLLVLDDDIDLGHKIKLIYRNERPVFSAYSIEQALDLLEYAEIGVLIADVVVNGENATDFVKFLKQQYPALMTIILTPSLDAHAAIALINQGQIFRYLRKPIGESILKISIQHGLRFYQAHKQNPLLLQRQRVDRFTPSQNAWLSERLIGRIRALRRRFGFSY